jgi:uncharacterized protein with HEPN domain
MSRDSSYLLDIFQAAKLALNYLEAKTKEEFSKDTQCQDAVIRRLEIIGEAAGRVSVATTAKFPTYHGRKWLVCVT